MSDFAKSLQDKCMNFSVRIVNLARFLKSEKHEYNIADQIFRSGTSIGANIAEAECAISKKDFMAKVYIALKECNETIYWLELLYRTRLIIKKEYESMYDDSNELRKILGTITKTTAENLKQQNTK